MTCVVLQQCVAVLLAESAAACRTSQQTQAACRPKLACRTTDVDSAGELKQPTAAVMLIEDILMRCTCHDLNCHMAARNWHDCFAASLTGAAVLVQAYKQL
jgi:hypothetical protein